MGSAVKLKLSVMELLNTTPLKKLRDELAILLKSDIGNIAAWAMEHRLALLDALDMAMKYQDLKMQVSDEQADAILRSIEGNGGRGFVE